MRRHIMWTLWTGVCLLASTALAFPPVALTDWGDAVPFGNGYVRAFFSGNRAGPRYLGVRLDAGALENTPTAPSDGAYDIKDGDTVVWPCCGWEIKPPLPASALEATAFEHVVLNYNPHGHPPPGVYEGHVHFDVHFYMITDEERLAIEGAENAAQMCPDISSVNPTFPPAPAPMTCEQVAEAAMDVPGDQMAAGHINVGAVEPGMGNHLVDITSHEFHGSPFTYTFIYGSYAGNLIFMEPMVTTAWLEQLRGQLCVPISMPSAFPEAGAYPTEYCMSYSPSEDAYYIYYRSFKRFPASGG